MRRNYTVGSLFAGVGGFDLGFERAGFDVRWQVEIDPFCAAVLARHWPRVLRYRDVREVGGAVERVDVLIGGFPCQDVSHAGKRVGIDGARSGLWSEYHRLIRELRPRIAVMENVAGLLTRGIDRVLGDLAEVGYDAEWHCVRASDVGAPHRRERIFIVAYPSHAGHGGWSVDGGGRDAELADRPCGGQREQRGTARPGDGGHAHGGDTGVGYAAVAGLEGHQSSPGDEGDVYRRATGPTRWPARPGEPQHDWEPPRVLERRVADAVSRGCDGRECAAGLPGGRTRPPQQVRDGTIPGSASPGERGAQPGLGGVPDGVSAGVHRRARSNRRQRLAALGNAIVPQVAEVIAWRVRALLDAQENGHDAAAL